MISWCAYCQKFQGEVQPFHKYSFTHGVCSSCAKNIKQFSELEEKRIKELQILHKKFLVIGRHGDTALIKAVVDEARAKGITDTNILVGMIAPALWEIGDLWAQNQVTFHDEHRFTFQMRKILHYLKEQSPLRSVSAKTDILLFNTEGNNHTLGIEILDFWLRDNGVNSQMLLWESFTRADLARKIELTNPKILGISVALPEQIPITASLVSFLKESLGSRLPKICVGGNALKTGHSTHIPGVTEIKDFKSLLDLI